MNVWNWSLRSRKMLQKQPQKDEEARKHSLNFNIAFHREKNKQVANDHWSLEDRQMVHTKKDEEEKIRAWSSRLANCVPQRMNELVWSTLQVQKVPWRSIRNKKNEISNFVLDSTKSIRLARGSQLPRTIAQARSKSLRWHPITFKEVKDPTIQ